jgi:hypothetical protein
MQFEKYSVIILIDLCSRCVQVVQMMGTDLLRQQQKWKDGLLEIRQIMSRLVEQVIWIFTNIILPSNF